MTEAGPVREASRGSSSSGSSTWSTRRRSLLPACWLLVVAAMAVLVVALWSWVQYVVVGGLVLCVVGWVLISVLSPAVPDRTCPACQKKGLVKIRRGELGVCCEYCEFRDEDMHVAYLDEW